MSNMSYCRYQNTLSDLQDCFDDMEKRRDETGDVAGTIKEQTKSGYEYEDYLSPEEKRAQGHLIELCREIIELVGDEED